ncbi:MAG: ArsR/SmtB family transcription factor [Halococcoides sp.]
MGRLLEITHRTTDGPDGPRVFDLDSPEGEVAIDSLSSETARRLLSALYDRPATPPELRDEIGTSLQNVHYHLEQLSDAGLIRKGGVSYSEKGTEMSVYEPAGEALLVVAGERSVRDRVRSLVTRVLGGVGTLAVATLAFAIGLDLFYSPSTSRDAGSESADYWVGAEATAEEAAATAQPPVDPVIAFALGGLVVLLVVLAVWAIRSADVEIPT